METAVYPGTFDPPTAGHIDIINRAIKIFPRVIVAVSDNPAKEPLFSLQDRVVMLKEIFKDEKRVIVDSFSGLLVDYLEKVGSRIIIRGLRAVSDFEYELAMALMNRHLNPKIETVFLMASEENLFVSSTIIKEVSRLGGNISDKVPEITLRFLQDKFGSDIRKR